MGRTLLNRETVVDNRTADLKDAYDKVGENELYHILKELIILVKLTRQKKVRNMKCLERI